jgi:hypothetical protein
VTARWLQLRAALSIKPGIVSALEGMYGDDDSGRIARAEELCRDMGLTVPESVPVAVPVAEARPALRNAALAVAAVLPAPHLWKKRKAPATPYFAVRDAIFARGDLDGMTKWVLITVMEFVDPTTLSGYPERAKLAFGAVARVSTVDRHLAIAKEKNIIRWTPKVTSRGKVNEYTFHAPDQWVPDAGKRPSPWHAQGRFGRRGVASSDEATPPLEPDQEE